MSTANKVLAALAGANEYVALGLQVGEVVVPLVKGAVKEIRTIASGADTVSYEVLLQVDAAELDAVDKLATDDLEAINLELKVRGVPEVPIAPPTPPTGS